MSTQIGYSGNFNPLSSSMGSRGGGAGGAGAVRITADNNGAVTLVGTGNYFDEVVVTGNARTAEGNQKQQRRMTPKKRESEYNI